MNLRRWWLPSVGAWLWLLLFLGLQLSPRRAELLNDGDPCWHWLQGDWIIKHGAVLRADTLSHTRPGAALICKDWASDVLWAVAGNWSGWSGVIFLTAVLIATSLWLLYRQLRTEGADALLAAALTLLAAWACSSHWLARPLLMTHVLAVLVGWTLRDFDRDRITGRQAGVRVAALMLVWANVHGGFFTGFAMIGLYVLGYAVWLVVCAPVNRRNLLRKLAVLAVLAGVAVVVSLLNPNGWRLHAHIIGFLRVPALALSTNEWRPPDFSSATMRGFVALLVTTAAVLMAVRPRLRPTDWVVAGGWGILALQASRNVAIFALVVTPMLAEHLTAALRASRGNWWTRLSARMSAFDRTAGGGGVVALSLIAVLLALAKPVLVTELPDNEWPAAAVRFLRANDGSMRGQMFNEYVWGGYLAQQLPDRKVFIDGRNDFYGPELVREYSEVSQLQPGWEVVLQKYGVGWTILPRAHRLNEVLAVHPQWQVAHTDAVATVYCRRSL